MSNPFKFIFAFLLLGLASLCSAEVISTNGDYYIYEDESGSRTVYHQTGETQDPTADTKVTAKNAYGFLKADDGSVLTFSTKVTQGDLTYDSVPFPVYSSGKFASEKTDGEAYYVDSSYMVIDAATEQKLVAPDDSLVNYYYNEQPTSSLDENKNRSIYDYNGNVVTTIPASDVEPYTPTDPEGLNFRDAYLKPVWSDPIDVTADGKTKAGVVALDGGKEEKGWNGSNLNYYFVDASEQAKFTKDHLIAASTIATTQAVACTAAAAMQFPFPNAGAATSSVAAATAASANSANLISQAAAMDKYTSHYVGAISYNGDYTVTGGGELAGKYQNLNTLSLDDKDYTLSGELYTTDLASVQGKLNVTQSGKIVYVNTLNIGKDLTNAGYIGGVDTLSVTGSLTNTGTLSNVNLLRAASVNNQNDLNVNDMNLTGALTNSGTVTAYGSITSTSVENTGKMIITGSVDTGNFNSYGDDASSVVFIGGNLHAGAIRNEGDMTVYGMTTGASLTNSGTMSLSDVELTGILNNAGTLFSGGYVKAGDTISNYGSLVTVKGIETEKDLTSSGDDASSVVYTQGRVKAANITISNGKFYAGTGVETNILKIDGANVQFFVNSNVKATDITNAGTVQINGVTEATSLTTSNSWTSLGSITTTGAISASGTFNVQGDVISGGQFTNAGTATITGTLQALALSNTGTLETLDNVKITNNMENKGTFTTLGSVSATNLDVTGTNAAMNVSGNVELTGNLKNGGKMSVVGGLNVGGKATINGSLEVGGNATVGETEVTGTATIVGNLNAQSDTILTENATLNVGGNANVGKELKTDGTMTIKGDLNVEEKTTISKGSLAVGGTANLKKDLEMTGKTSVIGSLNVGGKTTVDGSLEVGENATITGDAEVVGTATVVGDLNAKSNATVEKNAELKVGRNMNTDGNATVRGTLGVGGNAMVTGNTDVFGTATVVGDLNAKSNTTVTENATLNVGGTANITKDLILTGKTSVGGGLNVGGKATVDGSLEVGENATVEDNMGVAGTATVVGDLNAKSNTTVEENAELNVGGTVNVLQNLNADGTMQVTGGLNVGGNPGVNEKGDLNVGTKGTLEVGENATVEGNTNISGSATIAGDLNAKSNATVNENATLNVGGTANVTKELKTAGTTTIKGDLNVDEKTTVTKGTLTVGGTANLKKDLETSGKTTVIGGLNVGGKATVNQGGELEVGENATVEGETTINGTATVVGDLNANGKATIKENATLAVGGNATVKNELRAEGKVGIKNNLTAKENLVVTKTGTVEVGGNAEVAGTADVSGSATVVGGVNVKGKTTVNENASLAVGENASMKGLENKGTTTLVGDASILAELKNSASLRFGSQITVTNDLTNSGTMEALTTDAGIRAKAGLTNTGTINYARTIEVSQNVLNQTNATIYGKGFSSSFTAFGTVENYGTIKNFESVSVGALTNYNQLETTTFLSEGAVTNSGTMLGTAEGSLFKFKQTLENSGTMSGVEKLIVLESLTNTGTLVSTGKDSKLSVGYGDDASSVGLTNSGKISNFESVDVTGKVTNEATAEITASGSGSNYAFGSLENAGKIRNLDRLEVTGVATVSGSLLGIGTSTSSLLTGNLVNTSESSITGFGTVTNNAELTNNGLIQGTGSNSVMNQNAKMTNKSEVSNFQTVNVKGELTNEKLVSGTEINSDLNAQGVKNAKDATIQKFSTITSNGDVQNDGTILSTGSGSKIAVTGNLKNSGTIQNVETVEVSKTTELSGQIQGTGTTQASLTTGALTNTSESAITGFGTVTNNAELTNNGLIQGTGSNSVFNQTGKLTNKSVISQFQMANVFGDLINEMSFYGTGTDSKLTVTGGLTNTSGTEENPGLMGYESADISGLLTNSGYIALTGEHSNWSVRNLIDTKEGVIYDVGQLEVLGDSQISGTLQGLGTYSSFKTATMSKFDGQLLNFGSAQIDGDLLNEGTIQGAGENSIFSMTGELTNKGTLTNYQSVTVGNRIINESLISGTGTNSTLTVTKNGLINRNTGTIQNFESLTVTGDVQNFGRIYGTGTGSRYTVNGSVTNAQNALISDVDQMTISGNFTNAGTLTDFNDIQVDGDFTSTQDGVINVLVSDGEVSKITVNGKATVDGGTVNFYGERMEVGKDYTFLVVEGSEAGALMHDTLWEEKQEQTHGLTVNTPFTITASNSPYGENSAIQLGVRSEELGVDADAQSETSSIVSSAIPKLFHAEGFYVQNEYMVSLRRDYTYGNVEGATKNGQAVGAYLDRIAYSINTTNDFYDEGDLFKVLESLDDSRESGGNTAGNLDQLAGAGYANQGLMGMQNTWFAHQNLANFVRPLDCVYDQNDDPEHRGNNIWGGFVGNTGNYKSDGNGLAHTYDSAGVIVGYDFFRSWNFRGGAYFQYQNVGTTERGVSASSKADHYDLGLYGVYENEYGYLMASGNLSYGNYQSGRSIAFGGDYAQIARSHEGERGSFQQSLRVETAATFSLAQDRLLLHPFLGLTYIHMNMDDLIESGSNQYVTALRSSGYDLNSLRPELGARMSMCHRCDCCVLGMNARASWVHEFCDTQTTIENRFSNPNYASSTMPGQTAYNNPSDSAFGDEAASFFVTSSDLGRDYAWLGLGLTADTRSRWTFFGGYDCLLNNRTTVHTGNVGLSYSW